MGTAHDLYIVVKSLYNVPSDVWDEPVATHTIPGTYGVTTQVSLTPAQETMLLELYRILGLDPTAPLIVSKTQRSAGPITQSIEENVPSAGAVKVTRT